MADQRTFHNFKAATYSLPNDSDEQIRLKTQHQFIKILLDGNYPKGTLNNPKTIVDVGCGTGTWVMEMAQEFPEASIHGLDISDIQPKDAPENVKWHLGDATSGLPFPDNSVDFIQIRITPNFAADPDLKVYQACKRALRPGGVFFLIELSMEYSPDDTQSPAKSAFYDLSYRGRKALYPHLSELQARGRSGSTIRGLVSKMGGFRDLAWITKDIPIGPWVEDEKLKKVGELQMKNSLLLMDSYAAGMVQMYHLDPAEVHTLREKAKVEMQEPHRHVYWPYDFVWGFKI